MGLTIHYSLRSDTTSPAKSRQLVKQLRQRAMDLPFKGVGKVVEYHGRDADFENRANHDPDRWMLVQAGQYFERDGYHYNVPPKHLIAFSTDPGDGAETANFGLAQYPGFIKGHDGKRICTGLKGWSWSSFCKTQYASHSDLGGVENFLRCHLSVPRLLDVANELGIVEEVSDEGGFWERRDVKALVQEVGEWNVQLAGFVGEMMDHFGIDLDAPITDFPDFEHLEAEGRKDETN